MSRYWTTLVDKSEGHTYLAFSNNEFFVSRESSHVQLRKSLSTEAMGALFGFQVILFQKSDVFLQIIATYLVGEDQHYELGTHYP